MVEISTSELIERMKAHSIRSSNDVANGRVCNDDGQIECFIPPHYKLIAFWESSSDRQKMAYMRLGMAYRAGILDDSKIDILKAAVCASNPQVGIATKKWESLEKNPDNAERIQVLDKVRLECGTLDDVEEFFRKAGIL